MNRVNNPAKKQSVRDKLSAIATASGRQKNLMTAEAREKAIPKIAEANRGTKQTAEWIRKKTATWRETANKHGGMTPAHRDQLDSLHEKYRGPAHPNWINGCSVERRKRYQTEEYKAFVNACLKRDGYTCQHCGAKNGMGVAVVLQVHHIKSYAGHPELRYDPNNGITLCKSCHGRAGKGLPRPVDNSWPGGFQVCKRCGKGFRKKYSRRYCGECAAKYCCPYVSRKGVPCRRVDCGHTARKQLSENT